ncbi:low affinity iron permease family protein [Daejeonella lutea]|uniref:Low affinity Fe/Cu permease n=1 Tax=Daejeonella lutea TaxID=572036 RepID=A0A1T5AW77_9SPHI|nr:low affinity iron permease family protein [Daejeonella lutea]SKB39216.1 Low affinity Fe/Cu permease [Daejeonella lutea]
MSNKKQLSFFERFSNKVTSWAGSSYAFSGAFLVILAWAASGPFFNFSETWQLVINTGTTIITFLMVFLIQKAQNKDSKAIQLKLNELIAADERASNRMVDLEDMTEEELDKLHKFYEKLSDLAEKEDDIHTSHSIDAAEKVDQIKKAKKSSPVKKVGLTGKKEDMLSDATGKSKKPVIKRNAK